MREFNALQLKAYLDSCDEQPLLLDVRQPWEFDVCKIENSVLIPMSQIPSSLESLDSNRETVVICHHGIRSRRVGYYLEQAGFSNVINLSGGVSQWAMTVDKQMPTY
ncbi:MAG: sulfurtransferase [Gammaproteobacteria bacterium]|jgi:rhodanese-related sulfurtransferase|nr:sulfurtransferase [Gammaproteobacteria bacterium]